VCFFELSWVVLSLAVECLLEQTVGGRLVVTDDWSGDDSLERGIALRHLTKEINSRAKGKQACAQSPEGSLVGPVAAKEVKAVKLSAIQLDSSTVSDFKLACFRAYIKSTKQS
jgi:hypothetical protein